MAETLQIQEIPSATQTLYFACRIPEEDRKASMLEAQNGIVGTITRFGSNCIYVWFGWGNVQSEEAPSSSSLQTSSTTRTTNSLIVAMPQRSYTGAFNEPEASSTSKLIGSSSFHTEQLCSQMADRLANTFQMSVLVSCELSLPDANSIEQQLVCSRAACRAEQAIQKVLREEIMSKSK